jgi:integrase
MFRLRNTWRLDMARGRSRYSKGYVTLTPANNWQANWFPYVTDPETGKEKRVHKTAIVGCKAKMRKFEAEEELRKLSGAPAKNKADTTVKDFIDDRWKPLHEGEWQDSTKETNEQLLAVLDAKFGKAKLGDLDKVELQKWLNELARSSSRSRVWHLRTFIMSICEEAVEQDYLQKNPARNLSRPITREPDDTLLEWSEYQAILVKLAPRDRLVVKVAGVCALRPEELFALRWNSLIELPNGRPVLEVKETVWRGNLRAFGKTDGSLDYVALPFGLAEDLKLWKAETKFAGETDFIFANTRGGFITKDNYLNRVLYPVKDALGLKKLNFQVLRRTFATRAYSDRKGTLKDVQKHLRHSKPNTALENYIKDVPESVFNMVDSVYEQMLGSKRVQ